MDSIGDDDDAKPKPPPRPPAATAAAAPKRVAGGVVLRARKKRRKGRRRLLAPASSAVGVGQGSVPPGPGSRGGGDETEPTSSGDGRAATASTTSEFDDPEEDELLVDGDGGGCAANENDALLCLRAYTRPAPGGAMAETCAYCPIFTRCDGDDNVNGGGGGGNGGDGESTHAAPFLPRRVLLHLLGAGGAPDAGLRAEEEVERMTREGGAMPLQLHGTAEPGSAGPGRGGVDEDDVAIMEASAFAAASEMALRSHFAGDGGAKGAQEARDLNAAEILTWLTEALLPRFAGRTWVSTGVLDRFLADEDRLAKRKPPRNGGRGLATPIPYNLTQTKTMIRHLVEAGLLLSRRGVGPGDGGDGHWLSLPGLGRAARSLVEGRSGLLRRLRSSRYGERRRAALEREIDRGSGKGRLAQSGKFVVMDALARGRVGVHETCAGEQFLRLAE
ncbi:hypothetical protein ACHAWF_017687 [Thalassiosira exigua]